MKMLKSVQNLPSDTDADSLLYKVNGSHGHLFHTSVGLNPGSDHELPNPGSSQSELAAEKGQASMVLLDFL